MPDSFLETIQTKSVLHPTSMLEDLHWPPLQQRRKQRIPKHSIKQQTTIHLPLYQNMSNFSLMRGSKKFVRGSPTQLGQRFYFSLRRALARQRNAIKIWKCHLKLQIRIEIVSVFTSHICQPYWQSCLSRHMKGLTGPLLFFLVCCPFVQYLIELIPVCRDINMNPWVP